jgi:hypothetical protein
VSCAERASISSTSSVLRATSEAAIFSLTRSILLLPGMGTMPGDFASNQASAICPAVALLRSVYLSHQVDDGLVGLEGFGSKAWESAADVVVGERLALANRAGEKTLTKG